MEETNKNNLLYFIKYLMQPGVFGRADIYVRNDHTGFDEEKDDVILSVFMTNGLQTTRYCFNSDLNCIHEIDYNLIREKYIKGKRVTDKKKNLVKELAIIINMIKLQRMYNDKNNSVMIVRYTKSVMQSFAFALKIINGSDQRYIKFFYKDIVHEHPFIIIGERPTNGRGQNERMITHNTFLEKVSSASIFSIDKYFTFLCEKLEEAVGGFVA